MRGEWNGDQSWRWEEERTCISGTMKFMFHNAHRVAMPVLNFVQFMHFQFGLAHYDSEPFISFVPAPKT